MTSPETAAEKVIQQQYQDVSNALLALLEGLGVERVEALGKDFDARDHEAVQMQESLDYADQVVCVQYQRGYRVGGRLVRPALVVVSSGPGPGAVAPDEEVVEEVEGGGQPAPESGAHEPSVSDPRVAEEQGRAAAGGASKAGDEVDGGGSVKE